MKRLVLPLVLLIVGLGGGVGAGLFFAAPAEEEGDLQAAGAIGVSSVDPTARNMPGEGESAATRYASAVQKQAFDESGMPILPMDRQYVAMKNQFIVPLLRDGNVGSLIIVSISIEVPTGQTEAVLLIEPRLRDTFLQVLFDHANTGGFDGTFTAATPMRSLRASLLTSAQNVLGAAILDVLIVDMVRQEV